MIQNYLKIAWRNFYKHRFYTLINVLGLAMGIGCSIILFLFISWHLSFDDYHINPKRIYRIVNDLHVDDGSIDYDEGSPLILGQTLKEQCPAIVKEGIFLKKRSFTIAVQGAQKKENLFYEKENVAFANNDLFAVFSYKWLMGNAGTALSAPNAAVITATLAKKYFNTNDAIGKTIRIDDKVDITITGVLTDNRDNTDVKADMFISLASVKNIYPDMVKQVFEDYTFISSKNNVFVLLAAEGKSNAVNSNINSILKKALGPEQHALQFHLQPLAEVHFDSRYSGTISKPLLLILALAGIALLLIASVNFINMATAQSLGRAKEIGMRKVLGSSKKAIFWQFITETAYVAVIAALIALAVTGLFLPTVNNWLRLPLAFNTELIIFLIAVIIIIVFLAGFYPAVMLSRFKPINALKTIAGSGIRSSKVSRSVLIITQNTVAQLLIVCTLIITLQIRYLKSADMGFNKDAVIMVPLPKEGITTSLRYFRDLLSNYTGIKSVSFCYSAPSAPANKGGSIRYDGKDWEKFTENSIIGDENYLKTFGITLLAGRNMETTDTTAQYLINEQTLSKLGIKSSEKAIGHHLVAGDFSDKQGVIVGVVKDFHSRPLYNHIEPTLIAALPGYYRYAAIKIAGYNQAIIINSIARTWKTIYPHNVFDYHFLDQQIADFYEKEEMISRLIKVSTIVAILISCSGMVGLVSLITVQRNKEIGIRKVLGASVSSIVALMTRDFIRLVAIAIMISTPLAWWGMHYWLQNFAFHIDIKWWLFGLSALMALGIAIITVSLQAAKAAMENPVNSLKNY